jgi:DnaD/phage-associated family protein
LKDDKHKSVILYSEWKKPLQNLSLEQKGRILDALLDFPDGIIPTFDDPVLQIAWSFMEGGLQENARKWEATRKKRSDAGKKGNESRWHSSEVDSTCRKNRICDTCDDSIANIAVSGSVSVSGSAEEESKEETAADSRTNSGLAEIVQHFQEVIGVFPRSALDKLQRYQEAFSTELICKACDEAAESGHRSWKYVNGILKSWQADGVRTLGDVETRREARKKAKEPAGEDWQKMEVLR